MFPAALAALKKATSRLVNARTVRVYYALMTDFLV